MKVITMGSLKSAGMRDVLARLITDLNDRLVIVEGKRDVAALKRIGVRCMLMTIEQLSRAKSLSNLKVVILTDFDHAGEIKRAKAESMLAPHKGALIDSGMRIRFRKIFGARTIEEVPHIFERLCKE